MSGNGNKAPKRQRRGPKLVPLLMLGSDGLTYACSPAKGIPPALLKAPGVVVAIRLSRRERDVALDALQIGVQEAAKTLTGIVGRKLDS
jgi:hypothetical protein